MPIASVHFDSTQIDDDVQQANGHVGLDEQENGAENNEAKRTKNIQSLSKNSKNIESFINDRRGIIVAESRGGNYNVRYPKFNCSENYREFTLLFFLFLHLFIKSCMTRIHSLC